MFSDTFSLVPPEDAQGLVSASAEVMNVVSQQSSAPLADVLISAPVLSSALMFSGVAMVLGVAGPTSADQYAVLGALAALAIVIVHVRKTDPSLGGTISVVSGTLVGGVAGPGALVSWAQAKDMITDTSYNFITFHWWVLLGFFLGLSGWMVAQGFYVGLLRHIPDFFAWLFSKIPSNPNRP